MKNWSLNRKIWSIIGLLSFAFIISSVFCLFKLVEGRDAMNEITTVLVKRDQLTSELKDNQRQIMLVTLESILKTDDASLKEASDRFLKVVEDSEKNLKLYESIAGAEEKAVLAKYQAEFREFVRTAKESQALGAKNKNTEATNVIFSADARRATMRGYLADLNKMTADKLEEASKEANSNASKAIVLTVVISTASIFFSLLLAFFVLQALSRSISAIVKGLSDSSTQVSAAATQIASASEELSQATTEQAASLEETAASVEEMNSMVAKNSENANSSATTSAKSQQAVNQGKEVVKKMIDSMAAINRSSEGMAEVVKVIEQIDKKTKVINEIVNKTELLSFNASVEAARAGEHGKGFAVVAEEVGNLARMSGVAAEEIGSLLEQSIATVNQMVADTRRNVDTGAQVTHECGSVFDEVVENVNSVSNMANEIASASQEQSRGCTEITRAMSQLDQMTQQNASTSEECASAAEELSAQAEALKGAIEQLVLTVNGRDGDVHAYDGHMAAPVQVIKKPINKLLNRNAPGSPNVVHLKSNGVKSKMTADMQMKKAAGEAPEYDSDGFRDV